MSSGVHELHREAERALRAGHGLDARAMFVAAGDRAVRDGRWRDALESYRLALELDMLDAGVVARCEAAMRSAQRKLWMWSDYATAIAAHPEWPHFACRDAQLVIGDDAQVIACPGVGAVLDVRMTDDGALEVQPTQKFTDLPIAMAMVIVRRAVWPRPRHIGPGAALVRYLGRLVRLTELGEWGDPP